MSEEQPRAGCSPEGAWDRARAAWPGVSLPREAFAAAVAARGLSGADLEAHGADLFLACACLAGDGRALAAFEEDVLRPVRPAIARLTPDDDFIDEVLQELRTKLLVGESRALGSYGGRGPLGGWVRVAATRTAIDALRSHGQAPRPCDVAQIWDAHDLSPELRLLTEAQKQRFQEALHAALAGLPVDARNLLRRHLVDGMTLEEMAAPYGVHPATIARRLAAVRADIARAVRVHLAGVLGALPDDDFESLFRAIRSQVYVSLSPLLGSTSRAHPPG